MHKNLILVLGAAMLFTVASAHAQERPVTFGISGGPSFPIGSEFSEEAGTGYHVQGSLGFTPAALPIGLRTDLLWQVFPDEHDGSFREIGGLVNAIVGAPVGSARGYLLGGVGAVNHSPPDEDHGDHAHEYDGETTFAWVGGVGVEFPFVGLRGVLEVRYLAAGSEHRGVPISFGIRF